jgi:hypothetical protein
VRTPDRQDQQHRIEPDESGRLPCRVPEKRRRTGDQSHRGEAREDGDRLQRPQPTREAKGGDRVADEREEGPVGGMLKGPADEGIGGIGEGLCWQVGVGVEAMQRAHAPEGQIPKDVLGDQRWPEQQDQMCNQDRPDQRPARQRARRQQHEEIARAHHEHKCLEARAREAHVEAFERTRQPTGPTSDARGHVLRWCSRSPGADQEGRCEDPQQPKATKRAERPGGALCPLAAADRACQCAFARGPGYWGRGLDAIHCYVWQTCKSGADRYPLYTAAPVGGLPNAGRCLAETRRCGCAHPLNATP